MVEAAAATTCTQLIHNENIIEHEYILCIQRQISFICKRLFLG